MMRSKSEVIIADHLSSMGLEYGYEQPLTIDGVTKYPDFTVEDAESGASYYWEHCGMLHVPTYRRRWEEKLAWYRAKGILPREDGEGSMAARIVCARGKTPHFLSRKSYLVTKWPRPAAFENRYAARTDVRNRLFAPKTVT